MRSVLISILSSVMFLLTKIIFVIIGVRCEDTINSEEITTSIEELNSLFRNIQINFLKEVFINITENDKKFFEKEKDLKKCLDELNEIKLNDTDFKIKMAKFFYKTFKVVSNDNIFLEIDDLSFLKFFDIYSLKLANEMFLTYKYDNFQTLTVDEKKESIRKLKKENFYLYAIVAKRLDIIEVGCKYQKYDKMKEFLLGSNYDLNSKCLIPILKDFPKLFEKNDSIILKKLIDMIFYYDEKVDQINVFTAKVDKKELSFYNEDFDVILSKFDIDLNSFIKNGEEIQILFNEIVNVLELFKKCLLVLNQKESKLIDVKKSIKILISKIQKKLFFYVFNVFHESDKVFRMLYKVKEKLVKFFNNLESNDSTNN
ncbi:hypothetical protein HERIO_671 [Hepatospora eriocheir]|uniref:Uncharacterized protein n=1 Tax=Hepatospora eriocheir TaxID=1081669 RepID=A0A1X0QCB4_9MICR|nr:hypothetical protein HERIO_671 [Hepatospora eriocheir]